MIEPLRHVIEQAEQLDEGMQQVLAEHMRAAGEMVEDMKAGRPFRPELRVHQVHKVAGVWEMTWAPNGRATFMYGKNQEEGEQHIIWRHIGGHEILDKP